MGAQRTQLLSAKKNSATFVLELPFLLIYFISHLMLHATTTFRISGQLGDLSFAAGSRTAMHPLSRSAFGDDAERRFFYLSLSWEFSTCVRNEKQRRCYRVLSKRKLVQSRQPRIFTQKPLPTSFRLCFYLSHSFDFFKNIVSRGKPVD